MGKQSISFQTFLTSSFREENQAAGPRWEKDKRYQDAERGITVSVLCQLHAAGSRGLLSFPGIVQKH